MSKLFIGNSGSDDITIINGNNDTALSPTIPSLSYPSATCVLPNDKFVYITDSFTDEVKKYDVATNALVATISMPINSYPQGVCAHPSSLFIYVSNAQTNNVTVIDVTTDTIITSILVGSYPYGICCLPNGNKVYVANYYDGTVSVIDTTTLLVIGLPINVGGEPIGVCSNTVSNSFVYVASKGTFSISKIDTSTDTVVSTLSVPFRPNNVVSTKDDAFIYASTEAYHVLKISTATFLLDTDIVGPLSGIGIDINGSDSKVYVVGQTFEYVAVIDRITNAILTTIPVGTLPISLGHFISNFDIPTPSKRKRKNGCCYIYVDSSGNKYNFKKGGPILSGR